MDSFLNFLRDATCIDFLLKKKAQGKNEIRRNLSTCVLERFNGYETIRNNLARKEKVDFRSIDIVYTKNSYCIQKLYWSF